VEAVVGRVLEVQYGRGTEVFGWYVLEEDQGRHNIPMPAPGPWTLQVRFVARGEAGPVGAYSLAVTGEWWGKGSCTSPPVFLWHSRCGNRAHLGLMLGVPGFVLPDDKIVNEADVAVDTSVSWNGCYGSAHPAVHNGRTCVLKVRFPTSPVQAGLPSDAAMFATAHPWSTHMAVTITC
jgi:hypothetical protein